MYTDPFASPSATTSSAESIIAEIEGEQTPDQPMPAPEQEFAAPDLGVPTDQVDAIQAEPQPAPQAAPQVNPEIETLRLEVERMKAEAELARYQSTLPEPEKEPELAVPEQPAMPSDYNPEDSFNDRSSSSWRYREAQEQYNRDMQGYQFEQSRRDQQLLVRQLERIEGERQAQAQQAQAMQAVGALGADAQAQKEFAHFLANEQLTFEDMYSLFKAKTGGALDNSGQSGTVPPNPQQNAVQGAARRLDYPVPSAVAAGSSGSQKSLTDSVFDEVMAAAAGTSVAFT